MTLTADAGGKNKKRHCSLKVNPLNSREKLIVWILMNFGIHSRSTAIAVKIGQHRIVHPLMVHIVACQAHPVLVFYVSLEHCFMFFFYASYTLNRLKGLFVLSAPAERGFAEDPTSLACDNIYQLVYNICYLRILASYDAKIRPP